MVTSRLQLLAALAICCACNPGPLEVVGLRCSAERPCGDGLTCLDGLCGTPVDSGTDAGVVIPVDTNLLVNPGFETKPLLDGGTVGWRPTSGALVWLDGGYTGAHSARLEAGASQPSLAPANATPGTTIGMLFCASLWVRSDSDAGGGDLTLQIRERLDDGGTQNSSTSRLNAPRTAWKRLTEDYVAFGNGAVDLRLIASRLDAGEGLTLDEVSLIRASGPSCPP
jgi:hypothetical protein